MKIVILSIITLLSAFQLKAKNDQVTVVISLDGFRWDYPQWYNTPFLDRMAAEGVEASLIPSFPSKTFPNHYTIVTGLYPDRHGIIANSFLCRSTGQVFSLSDAEASQNPKYYGGEPIWLTAQRQGLRTAVFYWPGSDVAVGGKYPDKYLDYSQEPRLTFEERIDGVISQLKLPPSERPDLIMAYFEQPDHNGHTHGPQAKETRLAVMEMDQLIGRLYERIRELPVGGNVNLIVLSDHGMTHTLKEKRVPVSKYLKKEWYETVIGDVPANIYAREGCADSICIALQKADHVLAWKRADIPAYLHYGSNANVGDVVVSPDLGWLFTDSEVTHGGMHGFDPSYNDMHALFRAVGPAFRNVSHSRFPNVDVYPLLCHLLGIEPSSNDGSLDDVRDMLAF
jgi:predicted AlkP superfamily pyrophosphatase or phosphodiesterase